MISTVLLSNGHLEMSFFSFFIPKMINKMSTT